MDLVCSFTRTSDSYFPSDHSTQVLANLLSLAAVCPFVGSLSDLIGRRYVALAGAFFLVLGSVIASTAGTMNTFICRHLPPSSPSELMIHGRWHGLFGDWCGGE